MAHIPHLLLSGPWDDKGIRLSPEHEGHLSKVLRRSPGSTVSYTDGAGRLGTGTLEPGLVVRGREETIERPFPTLCMAVAAPRSRHRVRFIVEKLVELGVDELCWVSTRFGQGDPPGLPKARAWAIAALEQSKGAWLMEVSGPVALDELTGMLVVTDLTGSGAIPPGASRYTVLVGPEGGFNEDEMPLDAVRIRLANRVLRTETAAIVGASAVLKELDR